MTLWETFLDFLNSEVTLWETLLISLIISLFTPIVIPVLVSRYISTYANFRKSFIDARVHLLLYVHIYTNSWLDDEITPSIRKNINAIQESLRSIYVNIETSYRLIPKEIRRLLEIIGFLPDRKTLDDILRDLLALHTFTIHYRSKSDKTEYGSEELKERKRLINKVNKIIDEYIK